MMTILIILTAVVLLGALVFLDNVLQDRQYRAGLKEAKPVWPIHDPVGRLSPTVVSDTAAEAARLLIHADALDAAVVKHCQNGLTGTAAQVRREANRMRARAREVALRIGVTLP